MVLVARDRRRATEISVLPDAVLAADPSPEFAPGDIEELKIGNIVPADVRPAQTELMAVGLKKWNSRELPCAGGSSRARETGAPSSFSEFGDPNHRFSHIRNAGLIATNLMISLFSCQNRLEIARIKMPDVPRGECMLASWRDRLDDNQAIMRERISILRHNSAKSPAGLTRMNFPGIASKAWRSAGSSSRRAGSRFF